MVDYSETDNCDSSIKNSYDSHWWSKLINVLLLIITCKVEYLNFRASCCLSFEKSYISIPGSQRHSLISSVTTVSSSRDELLEAFENFNRNPPPPIVYETEADSLSQPTDSSTGTEPGICLFTQSPPQPDEQREASCEVPRYESKLKKRSYIPFLLRRGSSSVCQMVYA